MNRVEQAFASLRAERRGGLAPFVVAGQVPLERTTDLLTEIERAGADMIEIGIPFSDPVADGPVIAASMHRALEAGVTSSAALEAIGRARDSVSIPLIGMVSVSIVHRVGPAHFAEMARDAGLDGVIFPDAPLEEAEVFTLPTREAGLTASLLIAPTTPIERARRIAATSSGFVYIVARAGVTGVSASAPEFGSKLTQLKQITDLPLAVGFGISEAAHVRSVLAAGADAAIVGSALVRKMEEAGTDDDAIAAAGDLVRSLRAGVV